MHVCAGLICSMILGYFNVPVDSFMVGSISVEIYYKEHHDQHEEHNHVPEQRAEAGACSELNVIATSVPSKSNRSSHWNGTFCR